MIVLSMVFNASSMADATYALFRKLDDETEWKYVQPINATVVDMEWREEVLDKTIPDGTKRVTYMARASVIRGGKIIGYDSDPLYVDLEKPNHD